MIQGNIFLEPEMRNQGPATGFCAAKLLEKYPDEPFMLIQADVLRTPSASFIDYIGVVEQLVLQNHCLVTGIVKPKHGLVGIDFIIPGDMIESKHGMNVYSLDRWVMREDKNRKELENNHKPVFGHANHYSCTPRILLQMYHDYAKEWYTPLSHMMDAFGTSREEEVVRKEYALMPVGPIEARVANHAMKNGMLVECPFEWIDFGTWDSVEEYFQSIQLESKNLIEVDSQRNFAISDKLVALIGVEDLVVIDTKDALLITKSGKSNKMTEIIQVLKKRNPELL
jgi:mannose-1-phosphate guanylyltransferase